METGSESSIYGSAPDLTKKPFYVQNIGSDLLNSLSSGSSNQIAQYIIDAYHQYYNLGSKNDNVVGPLIGYIALALKTKYNNIQTGDNGKKILQGLTTTINKISLRRKLNQEYYSILETLYDIADDNEKKCLHQLRNMHFGSFSSVQTTIVENNQKILEALQSSDNIPLNDNSTTYAYWGLEIATATELLIQKIQNQYFTQYGCLLDLSYIVAVQSLIQLYLQNKPPEDLLDDQKSNTNPSVYESGFDTTMIGDICSFIQAFYGDTSDSVLDDDIKKKITQINNSGISGIKRITNQSIIDRLMPVLQIIKLKY